MPLAIFLFALVILFIIIGPLLVIWSLNTLFNLTIPFNLSTWFAALVLEGVLYGAPSSSSKET